MKSGNFCVYAFLSLFFLISACQDDKGKNDYSGVSDLIADRNRARYDAAENSSKKNITTQKAIANKPGNPTPESTSKEEELSSIILYEEEINIVGSESGRTLAKGVAYINKKGQIVRIKVLKE